MVRNTSFNTIPNYLKANTILEPEGNIAAEVGRQIAALRPRPKRYLLAWLVFLVIIGMGGALAYYMKSSTKYVLSAKDPSGLNIPVKNGQIVVIKAEGRIHTNQSARVPVSGCDEWVGPEGLPNCRYVQERKELYGYPFMALIGEFGEEYFLIGKEKSKEFFEDGTLWLFINDWRYSDNEGKITIYVRVSSK